MYTFVHTPFNGITLGALGMATLWLHIRFGVEDTKTCVRSTLP